MTTFNQLYIEVPPERRETIQYELEQDGLSVYRAGIGTKSLIACPFCRGAEEAGLETARALNEAIAGLESPTPLKIGYAGCALGTSEPLLRDIGVVKMRDAYDLYLGGEPKGTEGNACRSVGLGDTGRPADSDRFGHHPFLSNERQGKREVQQVHPSSDTRAAASGGRVDVKHADSVRSS